MASITITETTDGKKKRLGGIPLWAYVLLFIVQIPFRIIGLVLKLFVKGKKHIPVTDSSWTSWNSVNGHEIDRRIISETGFDGCIKFYELRTNENQIHELLKGKIFGEFHCETNYGLFLRQFDNPDDWPVSYLIFIDKSNVSLQRLKKTKSSWPDWKYESINDKDFDIITEPGDTYTTKLNVRNNSH
ncbi:MAG TPA: hypothetical protein VK826_08165 [Bacteroidia bacterium]|nr:hypothetical protein [Bacteroidia bacterium]